MAGEAPKAFGLNLMKVEEQFMVDGKIYKFEDTGGGHSSLSPSPDKKVSPSKMLEEEQR
jgi:hypothetical protein